jgi:hypothetical protein
MNNKLARPRREKGRPNVERLKEPKETHVTNFCQGYAENISFIPPRRYERKAVQPEENRYANRISVQQFETPLTQVNKIFYYSIWLCNNPFSPNLRRIVSSFSRCRHNSKEIDKSREKETFRRLFLWRIECYLAVERSQRPSGPGLLPFRGL